MKLSNVLVATDFSAISEVALGVAVDIAETSRARLHIVHVVPPVTDVGDAAARLDQLKGRVDPRVPVETALLSGRAARQIVRYAADKGIDLIVAGTHGRTGLSRAILGSVAEAVLRTASCPVLTVPPATLQPEPKQEEASQIEEVGGHRCIVCGSPTDDLACEGCRTRIRAEALAQKLRSERAGHRGLPV